jgi:hypothetical protein
MPFVMKILHLISWLLPALLPSWRFFDYIGPSPRIEICLLPHADSTPAQWQAFNPRPAHVSSATMLRRLFWNPVWNESLYLLSCSEKIIERQSQRAEQEIALRIAANLQANAAANGTEYLFFVFRLIVIERGATTLTQHEVFRSPATPLTITHRHCHA